ncbi:hypothetical protein EBR96_10135, partial [bacterium]|nr:hypothetical protein [bacterium]
ALVIGSDADPEIAETAAQIAAKVIPVEFVWLIQPKSDLLRTVQRIIPDAKSVSLADITNAIGNSRCEAIRWIGTPSQTILTVASHHQTAIFCQPLGEHALWELPRWMREISLSATTHRFGNISMGFTP